MANNVHHGSHVDTNTNHAASTCLRFGSTATGTCCRSQIFTDRIHLGPILGCQTLSASKVFQYAIGNYLGLSFSLILSLSHIHIHTYMYIHTPSWLPTSTPNTEVWHPHAEGSSHPAAGELRAREPGKAGVTLLTDHGRDATLLCNLGAQQVPSHCFWNSRCLQQNVESLSWFRA